MNESQRNILIVVAIAIALSTPMLVSGFALTSGMLFMIFSILFTIAIAWFLWGVYRAREGTINALPTHWRLLLQASAAVAFVTSLTGIGYPGWAGRNAGNAALFFVLMAGSVLGIYYAWQQRTSRW